VDVSEAPEITAIADGDVCDLATQDCSQVELDGQIFVDSPDLTCHLQLVKVRILRQSNEKHIIHFHSSLIQSKQDLAISSKVSLSGNLAQPISDSPTKCSV
jgi:hypothetical protein